MDFMATGMKISLKKINIYAYHDLKKNIDIEKNILMQFNIFCSDLVENL